MASNNLRPDLRITQIFTPVTPVVPPSELPVLLIGINRHYEFQTKADLSSWNANSATVDVAFPGWLGGTIDPITSADTTLIPKVYVRNTLGTAELTGVTFDLVAQPPSFDIAGGASATFSIGSGASGAFQVNTSSPVVGTFSDDSANFISSGVDDGTEIYVDNTPTYVVDTNGLVSESALTVRRKDKGPRTAGASEVSKFTVYPEDDNGIRRLVSHSDSFLALGGFSSATKVNDLVRLDNWNVLYSGDGIVYTATGDGAGTIVSSHLVVATERTVTYPSPITFATYGNDAGGGVVFLRNSSNEIYPAFYATTGTSSSTTQFVKNFAASTLPSAQAEQNGAVFYARSLEPIAGPSLTGGYTTADGSGRRVFYDSTLASLSPVSIGSYIAIKGTDGIYRPTFVVLSPGDDLVASEATDTNARVRVAPFVRAEIPSGYTAASVDYVVFSPTTVASYAGATVTKTATARALASESALTLNGVTLTGANRILTAPATNFRTAASVGSLIFDDSGFLDFVVTAIPSPSNSAEASKVAVQLHEFAGLPLASTETISGLGFSVREAGTRADFRVRRVVSASTIEIEESAATPNQIPAADTILGAVYFQTPTAVSGGTLVEAGDDPVLVIAPDSSASINYSIKKTLSGADLSGDVLVTYSEVRTDDLTVQEVTASTYEEELGPAVPSNPLSLAARIATANTPTAVYTLRVAADTTNAWQTALDSAKTPTVYSIVPLTQSASVLSAAQVHVNTESGPDNKRERILYQSALFPRSVVRAKFANNDVGSITRSNTQQLVTIERDLTSSGIVVGDEITVSAFNGTEVIQTTGSVLAVTVSGDTVIRMLPDGNIPVDADYAVVDFTVTSKYLNDAGLRDAIKDYALATANRRVRNIYPDNVSVSFTDTTGTTDDGFYGGGEVTDFAVGGFYLCALEAAKRARFGPVKPLTKTPGTGIYKITDPFATNAPYQDTIINAGTYYMEQVAGAGSNVQAIRALTTDASDLVFVEDSVTTQIDNFARKLRTQLKPLLGPYILDEGFFTLLSAQQGAVAKELLDSRAMRSIQLTSMEESETVPDTFLLTYTVEPYFSAARGEITIYI